MINTITTIVNEAIKLIELDIHKSETTDVLKSDKHDIKLAIDKKLGDLIYSHIQKDFPTHSIISEENEIIIGQDDYTWIIDPLDGSVNYFYGLPFYGISIACFNNQLELSNQCYDFKSLLKKPVIGIIYIPYNQKLYWAIHNHGAYCNTHILKCPENMNSQDVLLSMNFSGRQENMKDMDKILSKLVKQVKKIRSHGATAVDLAYIASGNIGALIQRGIKIWDFAAAYIILTEAGGKFSTTEREPNSWDIIASFPNLHDFFIREAAIL
ncbi:MAG: hypothetical protein JXR70_02840 [Spirochaetales bacterium]|nr:hypothetical protein [Spirochaetales bacterium]